MAQRLRIGLTGGIASGKSTVAERFEELGVAVIDADDSARRVVAPGTTGLRQVIDLFGPQLLNGNGELKRRALRNIIFADPVRRGELESLLHPLIRNDMERRAESSVGPYLVMAIPLLVEKDAHQRVNRILVVDVPENGQLARIMARDGGSLEQAKAILGAQASRASRLQAADDILLNVGTISELHQAVDALHARYLQLASATSG